MELFGLIKNYSSRNKFFQCLRMKQAKNGSRTGHPRPIKLRKLLLVCMVLMFLHFRNLTSRLRIFILTCSSLLLSLSVFFSPFIFLSHVCKEMKLGAVQVWEREWKEEKWNFISKNFIEKWKELLFSSFRSVKVSFLSFRYTIFLSSFAILFPLIAFSILQVFLQNLFHHLFFSQIPGEDEVSREE